MPWRQGYLHRLDDLVDSMDELGSEKASYRQDIGKFHLTNAALEES